MNRRLAQALVLTMILLVPAIALAGDVACVVGGGGSDTGKFGEIMAAHGALVAVLASFGFGVMASLTPCVYPMVPITVSIFGATGRTSRWVEYQMLGSLSRM